MKLKKYLILLLTAIIVVSALTPVLASTHKYGAKAYGMGGAFTAVADDSSAIYWNPAGLTQSGLFGTEVSIGADPDDEFIEDAQDVIDAGDNQYEQLKALNELDDIEMSTDIMGTIRAKKFGLGVLANNEFTYDSTDKYLLKNQVVGQGILSMGHTFIEPPLDFGYFAIGLNVKGLWSQYDRVEAEKTGDTGDTTECKATAQGYGLDVGFLAKATDMVNLGLNIKNATSTLDWEWDEEPTNEVELPKDSLPRSVTVGAALNLPFNTTIAADIERIEDGDEIYHLGLEKGLLFNGLSLRTGMYKLTDGDKVITGGLGVNLVDFHLNLAADDDGYYSLAANLDF